MIVTAGDLIATHREYPDTPDSAEAFMFIAHRATVRAKVTALGFDEWLDSIPLNEVSGVVASVLAEVEPADPIDPS